VVVKKKSLRRYPQREGGDIRSYALTAGQKQDEKNRRRGNSSLGTSMYIEQDEKNGEMDNG